MPRIDAVTVGDVARVAGVSPGTVSKALTGTGQLRAETRERVRAVALELGYRPNHIAKGLQAGRSYLVGVLTTDSIGRFTIPILTGAEDVLGAGQMSMLLCESRGDAVRERHYLQTLLSRRVDGIIVTGRSSDERGSLGVDLPVPVVYALTRSTGPDDISVLHDDRQGAQLAIEHLLATGRRRIVLVGGPPQHLATTNRLQGTTDAMTAAGISLATEPLFGSWSEEWGREAVSWLIRSGTEFDGAFCMSDQIARGFSDGLREQGLLVPRDVGVVGMDNWDAMAGAARPPLTTVDLQLSRLGSLTASLLLAQIAGEEIPPGPRLVPASLVMRESTSVATVSL